MHFAVLYGYCGEDVRVFQSRDEAEAFAREHAAEEPRIVPARDDAEAAAIVAAYEDAYARYRDNLKRAGGRIFRDHQDRFLASWEQTMPFSARIREADDDGLGVQIAINVEGYWWDSGEGEDDALYCGPSVEVAGCWRKSHLLVKDWHPLIYTDSPACPSVDDLLQAWREFLDRVDGDPNRRVDDEVRNLDEDALRAIFTRIVEVMRPAFEDAAKHWIKPPERPDFVWCGDEREVRVRRRYGVAEDILRGLWARLWIAADAARERGRFRDMRFLARVLPRRINDYFGQSPDERVLTAIFGGGPGDDDFAAAYDDALAHGDRLFRFVGDPKSWLDTDGDLLRKAQAARGRVIEEMRAFARKRAAANGRR